MLVSTFELISLAASNSLAAFCFCNLIIAVLLVGSSKPRSRSHEVEPPTIANDDINIKKSIVSEAKEEKLSSVSIEMVDDEQETPDDEEENDELRKRAEEFIEKINNGWRAEKLKNTYLI